ncbi:MAG TPA: hypothetical protein VIH05_07190 [Tepidiformaceae bacterium]
MADEAGIRPAVTEYRLEDANDALAGIRTKGIRGAKVFRIS